MVDKYKKKIIIGFTITIFVIVIGVLYVKLVMPSRGLIPFWGNETVWSIGIYTGESPYSLKPSDNINNPVMTAKDVDDIEASFVADPFMVKEGLTWYMFFEVMNENTDQGDIGYTTSINGFEWDYQKIILDEPFHLSYPYVFKLHNDYYMIPESIQAGSVRLYKAKDFPIKWEFVCNLLDGIYTDPAIFLYNGKMWLFVGTNENIRNGTLRLFISDDLQGPYFEHPQSPIVSGDRNIARPGGRVLLYEGIVRFAQDDDPTYGNKVRAFQISELSINSYKENEVNLVGIDGTGSGWNADGMHHVDAYQLSENNWIACVDGRCSHRVFSLKY